MAKPTDAADGAELESPPRARASRSRKPRSKGSLKPEDTSPKKASSRLEGRASTLLVGAGVGAALTLSLVALSTKQRQGLTLFNKKSTLASVLVKTAVFAVARASTRGSLTNLFARAVGNSLA